MRGNWAVKRRRKLRFIDHRVHPVYIHIDTYIYGYTYIIPIYIYIGYPQVVNRLKSDLLQIFCSQIDLDFDHLRIVWEITWSIVNDRKLNRYICIRSLILVRSVVSYFTVHKPKNIGPLGEVLPIRIIARIISHILPILGDSFKCTFYINKIYWKIKFYWIIFIIIQKNNYFHLFLKIISFKRWPYYG